MFEINFGGKKIFEFKDSNLIQVIGRDAYLKRLIVNVYSNILNGYRFTDVDIEGMNGYYPEIIYRGNILKRDDIKVIKISNIEDIIEQLQVKGDSIFLRYLLLLDKELSISKALNEVELSLTGLSVELDRLIENMMSMGDVCVVTNVPNIDFKKIIRYFINIDFVNQNNQIKPLWLLRDIELINLFLNTIQLMTQENNNITIIVDGLDIGLKLGTYNYFIDELYNLVKKCPNFKIWLIPGTEKGIKIDYEIFGNTYILNSGIDVLGNFDITYESICRNYPDHNLPTEIEVLKSILKLFPFHHKNKKYCLSRETVILQVFLKLLGEDPVIIENLQLSSLETNFLTSMGR